MLTIVLKVMKIEMMLSQTIHHSDKRCYVSLVKFLQLKTSSELEQIKYDGQHQCT